MKPKIIIGVGAVALLVLVVVVAGYVLLVWRYRLRAIHVDAGEIEAATGTYRAGIEVDGRERDYLLHVPPAAAESGSPLPLLIALHGGGSDGERMNDLTDFVALADREGFLVAFPNAVAKNWNDGRPDVDTKAVKENVDDVGFIRALIDDVARRLPLDRRRIYATGISNGAFMSMRLACEASDQIAAVGLVSGTAPVTFRAWCAPERPVPVIAFAGTKDPLVPFEGGKITGPFGFGNRGRVISAAELQSFWAEQNQCSGPLEERLPDIAKHDGSTVLRWSFRGCRGGGDVVFYIIEGGGHTWPGGKQYLASLLVGKTNRDIDATELIWRFCVDHPLP